MTMQVWIELPKVETLEEARAHCDAANTMLARLGARGEFFWATDEQRHCATFYNGNIGGAAANGYTELVDRGQWFNLEILADMA